MTAKINALLKANGRRELSMDEIDSVVGGSGGLNVCQTHEEIDKYCDTVEAILNMLGVDLAISYVKADFPSPDIESCLKGEDGVQSLRTMLHNQLGK